MKIPATLTILALLSVTFADTAPPPKVWPRDVALRQILDDLKSSDPQRIADALAKTRASLADGHNSQFDEIAAMESAISIKKFAEVDAICAETVAGRADDYPLMAKILRTRVHALIGEGKFQDALSAAKSFYDVAPLDQTNDAITAMAVCLTLAHPDDHTIARRFKRQQGAASTQPSAQNADPAEPSIFAGIQVDPKPYADAIDAITLDEYHSFVKKGNLLLVADRTKEARQVFEQASDLAEASEQAEAVMNVARAIRAETGSVGQANAYILSLRDGK